jgi:hypothetical protein
MLCPYKEEALRSPLLSEGELLARQKAPATVRGRYGCLHI